MQVLKALQFYSINDKIYSIITIKFTELFIFMSSILYKCNILQNIHSCEAEFRKIDIYQIGQKVTAFFLCLQMKSNEFFMKNKNFINISIIILFDLLLS